MACIRSVVSTVVRKGIGVGSLKQDRLNHSVISIRNSSFILRSPENAMCCSHSKTETRIPVLPGSQNWCHRQNSLVVHTQRAVVKHYSRHHENWTDLAYEDFLALVDSRDIQLIDVREPKEIEETGSFPNAVNIPLGVVKEALFMDDVQFQEHFKVPKPQKHDSDIVFVGLGPIKSSAAVELAHKFGFKKARHYPGGYEEWSKKKMQ